MVLSEGLGGGLGLKYSAIMGDDMSDENFTKNFGDLNQYMDSQYEIGETSNPTWGVWSRAKNSTARRAINLFMDLDFDSFQEIPTIDGKIVYDHPDFLEFYKKNVSGDVASYGTNWRVNDNLVAAFNWNRDSRKPALVQVAMSELAPLWIQGSGTLNYTKLAKNINDYKLDENQQRRYSQLEAAQPKDGQIYSDSKNSNRMKASKDRLYTIINGKRVNLKEGSVLSGEVKDGVFTATGGVGDAGVDAVVRNGTWLYEGLIYDDSVQLSDGTKVKIPKHGTLAHDGSVKDNDGNTVAGFYNGYIKIDKDVYGRVMPDASSNYEVDEDGNVLIKAKSNLETIAHSPHVNFLGATGYAGAGFQRFKEDGLENVIVTNPVSGEEFTGGVESISESYYTDKRGIVYVLNDQGSYRKARPDVKIDTDGNVTYKGKKLAADGAYNFLKQSADGSHDYWTPVVYDNGKYDLERVNANGWAYSVLDKGWYYKSDREVDDGRPGAQWRWYAADGKSSSDIDTDNGIWVYTDDKLLASDRKQFSTEDGLGVYMDDSGDWRTVASEDLLDADGSGTFDQTEMLEHLKSQKDRLLDIGKIDQDSYDSSVSEIDEKINVINQQPITTQTPDETTQTPDETETNTVGEPTYYTSKGSGFSKKYYIKDANGNTIKRVRQKPALPDYETWYKGQTEDTTDNTNTDDTGSNTPVYIRQTSRGKAYLFDENGNQVKINGTLFGGENKEYSFIPEFYNNGSIYEALPDLKDYSEWEAVKESQASDTGNNMGNNTDSGNQAGVPVYYTSVVAAGKRLYNVYDEAGTRLSQQDTVPDVPSYEEYIADWQNSLGEQETGWGETYRRLDIENSEFETLEDGSLKLINPAFTGEPLTGKAAFDAANEDAANLARLAATAPGAQAGLSTKMISAGIDKLLGPEWNPIRWLNKLNGAEDMVNISIEYQRAQNAAAEASASNQNLATFVGAGQLAGKPWLNPGGTIQEQAAPFLQRKYIVNPTTGALELNAFYDPSLSDYIYNKGPDGIEGTADDFEQMWTPSWMLPWDYREMEAEWRVGYEGALQEQMDYYNKPLHDTDADGIPDQTAYEKKQEEGMAALYEKGFYNDPDQIYTITDEDGNVQYVDYKGNVIDSPPGAAPPGGYQEYSQSLYDELADDMYTWEFGAENDVKSRAGRSKQLNEANDYYRQLNDKLEELAVNKKLENQARLYNFAGDTSPMAEARTDAFNNTAKAVLYGGQGINKNMFTRQNPEEGYDFFGNKKAEAGNPYSVAAGGSVFNLLDPANVDQTPEQVLFNEDYTLPTINEDNIFLKNRKTPTTKTTATGATGTT
jgi:hypothetical protein